MVRNRKKVRTGSWTDDDLSAAVTSVKNGLSVRLAAKQHKVNRETLRRHCKFSNGSEITRNYNFKRVFTDNEENTLKNYLIQCTQMGYGLSPRNLRKIVYSLAIKNSKQCPASWKKKKEAGKDWMLSFMKRNPDLSLRKGEGTSLQRASCFNRNTVEQFFRNLENVYSRLPDVVIQKRIFNLDETSTTTVPTPRKVISPKGQKQVSLNVSSERGTLVTTCAIVSATGELLPPAMIFPRVNFQPRMIDGCYPDTLGLANPSGWVTSDLFVLIMIHFIKFSKSSLQNPSILIYDNHDSHISIEVIDLAKANGVTLLTLPPHCSHKLQPLDVCFFAPFKLYFSSAMSDWMLCNPGKHVTIYDLAPFVNQALVKAGTKKNIESAFSSTGIFPFNKNIFSDEEFAQSTVTDRPPPSPRPTADLPTTGASTSGMPTLQDSLCDVQELDMPTTSLEKDTPASSEKFIGPQEMFGLPKCKVNRNQPARKGRKTKKSIIATDTPIRNEIASAKKKRKNKEVKRGNVKKIAKALFEERETDESQNESDPDDVLPLQPTKCKNKKKLNRAPKQSRNNETDASYSDIEYECDINVNESNPAVIKLSEQSFKPVKTKACEGDYVVVGLNALSRSRDRKTSVFYVAKVIKEIDDDGDIEVSYLRQCSKSLNKFVLPSVPDLASVPMKDVRHILPKPTFLLDSSKRQNSLTEFNVDFSSLRMG